ncbi:MAG: hypothetical protein HY897_22040 [Deltaproteobacteria bacterium]|nr:hypothetical protein [Deltaproteobacteria bacterium]
MTLKMKLVTLAAVVPICMLLSGHTVHWNMFRADVQRTAFIEGAGEIATPAVKWKYYAGGSLLASQLFAGDVNNDGVIEYVLVSGGKVLCKLAHDVLIWDTPYVAAARIWALDDFDGDGRGEILVSTSLGRLMIFNAADGALKWENSDDDFNWIGTVKVLDLDGDALPDVYAADQACGSAVRQPAAQYGGALAYSFAGGFSGAKKIFALEHPTRDYYCGAHNEIADIDRDGVLEVVAPGDKIVYAYSTADGKLKYVSADIGAFPWGSPTLVAADLDNDGAAEIVMHVSSSIVRGSKRLLALKAAGGKLNVMWQASVPEAAYQRDNVTVAAGFVGDLDHDGSVEVVYSRYDGGTASWSAVVVDAGSACPGQTWERFTDCHGKKIEVPKARFLGAADIDGDGVFEVVLHDYTTNRAGVYHFTVDPAPAMEIVLTLLQGASVVTELDIDLARRADYASSLLTFDFGGDGRRDLAGVRAGNLEIYDVAGDPAVTLGSIAPAPNTARTFVRAVADPSGPGGERLVVHVNDGTLGVLNDGLAPENDLDGDGVFDLKSGGFVSSMLITDLEDDARPEIIVSRSGGFISAMDGLTTDLVNPPRLLWNRAGGLPTVADLDGDGKYEQIYGLFEGDNLIVDVLKPDMKRLYSGVIGLRGETDGFYQDLIFGKADTDSRLDIYYTYTDPNNNLAKYGVLAWDGTSATADKLWSGEHGLPYQGDGQGARTTLDVNGDGLDDFVINPYRELRTLHASDGALIKRNQDTGTYAGVVTVFEGMLIKHGGQTGTTYAAPLAFRPGDLGEAWASTVKGEYHGRYGAALKSDLGAAFFAAIRVDSAHLYVYTVSDGNLTVDKVLSCGRVFDTDQDAEAAGCSPFEIASVLAVKDITGKGNPAFVAGARDGWVYALDANFGTLLWSLNFRYPVGDLVAGDLDGDGKVEVLAAVGDGYVYAIDNAELPAPAWVYENDAVDLAAKNGGPDRCPADPDEDVDCQEVTSTLGANWAPLQDASGYEYAIISQNGTYITYWTDAGAATSIVTRDVRLVFDFKYYFLVRAYKTEKGKKLTSPETQSDGVKIVDITPPVVAVAANPNPITPDGDGLFDTTVIRAEFYDKTYVTEWKIEVLDKSGATLFSKGPEYVLANNVSAEVPYDAFFGGKRLAGGTYRVIASAFDIARHATAAETELLVCNEDQVIGEENGKKVCTCPDRDHDGHADEKCGGDDCDDTNREVHPGAYEDCDTGDKDCDGKPVECEAGTMCIDGYCATPCIAGECPVEFACTNSWCIPTGPCAKVRCDGDLVCIDGQCVDLCKNVWCGDGGVCVKGECVDVSDGGDAGDVTTDGRRPDVPDAPDAKTDAAKPRPDAGSDEEDAGQTGGNDGDGSAEASGEGGCSCATAGVE